MFSVHCVVMKMMLTHTIFYGGAEGLLFFKLQVDGKCLAKTMMKMMQEDLMMYVAMLERQLILCVTQRVADAVVESTSSP